MFALSCVPNGRGDASEVWAVADNYKFQMDQNKFYKEMLVYKGFLIVAESPAV